MKIKISKKGIEWYAGIWRGKGGISSLIVSRQGKRFWRTIRILFIPKYLYRALFWKNHVV